jgi:hypothetical protein
MAKDVDAVIAALRVVLREVERSNTHWWDAAVANRWVDRLPGAWARRWRQLKVKDGQVIRCDLITHLRATLAYLEVNRDHIKGARIWPWSLRKGKRSPEPVDAEFHDVAESAKPLKKTDNALVLVGGSKKP